MNFVMNRNIWRKWQQKVVRRLADEREAMEEECRTLKDEVDDFATDLIMFTFWRYFVLRFKKH